jgi:hypothetical protein
MRIVLVDESKSALQKDNGNIDKHQADAIENAELVIRMKPDGYLVCDSRANDVKFNIELVRPVSEAQMSAEKSKQHRAKRTKDEPVKSEDEMRIVIQERMLRSRSIPQPELKPRDFEF